MTRFSIYKTTQYTDLIPIFSGHFQNRISRLNEHVKECLCCLENVFWKQVFDDAYDHTWRHFERIFKEFDCPVHVMKTIKGLEDDKNFIEVIRYFVTNQVNCIFNSKHLDESSDSNESGYYFSDSSAEN